MYTASFELENGETVLHRMLLGDEVHLNSFAEFKKALFTLKLADYKNVFNRNEPELNQSERKLDAYMKACRDEMIKDKSVYFNYPPINPFYKMREIIENDPLLKVFHAMPKGGNLHIHTSATYNATKFVKMLCENSEINNNVVIYLGKESSVFKPYQLFFIQDSSLVDRKKGFYYLNDAIDKGVLTKETLISMLSMSDDRIDEVDYIWDEFNAIFARVSPIIKTKTVFKHYYTEALLDLVEDNIDYAEIRFGPGVLTDNNDILLRDNIACENILFEVFPEEDNTESIEIFRDAYYDVRKKHNDFKVKVIISGSRKKNKDEPEEKAVARAIEGMKKAQKWRTQIKDEFVSSNPAEFIIGYDLVSEEDRGYRTEVYAKAIYENNISIPFYFHDGESNWADCDNLYAAFLLGTKRAGHGINLFRFPAVMQNVIENNIALEVCPISNQLLRYTPDLRMHPIGEFLKRGVQCVICSDDPQIFNYSGLRYDFLELYYALLIDLRAVKKLIKNSYLYSGMEKSIEIHAKMREWQLKWDDFVAQSLEQFERETKERRE